MAAARHDKPILIAIGGGSGSGKTRLARRVQELVGPEHVSLLSMDQYFRTENASEPANVNFDHPIHLDLNAMIRHLRRLKDGRPTVVPDYDFVQMVQTPRAYRLEARRVLLVEGLFVLARPIVELFDLTCFLDVEVDQRLLGRILRDVRERAANVEQTVDRYQRFVRPSHNVFVAPTRENADVVVDFTYRRSFFTHLLAELVADFVRNQTSSTEFLQAVRRESYRLGFKPEESFMPMAVDIRQLAKAYPEHVVQHETLLNSLNDKSKEIPKW